MRSLSKDQFSLPFFRVTELILRLRSAPLGMTDFFNREFCRGLETPSPVAAVYDRRRFDKWGGDRATVIDRRHRLNGSLDNRGMTDHDGTYFAPGVAGVGAAGAGAAGAGVGATGVGVIGVAVGTTGAVTGALFVLVEGTG